MKTKLQSFTVRELQTLLNESKSFREFMGKVGYITNGSSGYENAKKQIKALGLQIPKYAHYSVHIVKDKRSNDDIFVVNSTYARKNLKKRIIEQKLIPYQCRCGNTGEWEGKRLSLQLEHKNGINNDNRLDNLEFLCPNCHSQSDTFAGKKLKGKRKDATRDFCSCGAQKYAYAKMCDKCSSVAQRKVLRPSYDELLDNIKKLGYSATGRLYGVSDNAIRKWLKT